MTAIALNALAQDYPTKSIRLIVPFGAGGGTDIIARGIAQKLFEVWGQQVIADNKPGAVHALLSPLAANRVSMSRIESRPSRAAKSALWEYFFFIDIEGHRNDERIANALAELAEQAPFLKVLGSYPAAVQ